MPQNFHRSSFCSSVRVEKLRPAHGEVHGAFRSFFQIFSLFLNFWGSFFSAILTVWVKTELKLERSPFYVFKSRVEYLAQKELTFILRRRARLSVRRPMAQYSGSRTEEPPIQCKGWKKISSSVFTHTNRWVPAKWKYVRIQQDLSLLSTFFFLLSIWWAFTAVHALGWVGLVREDIVQHVSF